MEHAIVRESEITDLQDKMNLIFTNGSQNQSYTSLAGAVFSGAAHHIEESGDIKKLPID